MKYAVLALLVVFVAVPAFSGDNPPSNPTNAAAQGAADRSSNDPAVLKTIIRQQDQQIAELKAELLKLQAARATTRPVSEFPSIEGTWYETPEILVTIIQDKGDWKAECSYMAGTNQISWEMKGTITRDGKIKGLLHHNQAPKGWAKNQAREGKLSADGNQIQGTATVGAASHQFTWNKQDLAREAADKAAFEALPADIKAGLTDHTLAVGMTMEQCNKALGTPGRLKAADATQKTYEWYQSFGHDEFQNPQGYIPWTGVMTDGKLTSFEKGQAHTIEVGTAHTSPAR